MFMTKKRRELEERKVAALENIESSLQVIPINLSNIYSATNTITGALLGLEQAMGLLRND